MKHQDTISQFTDCLSDVEALMRASRLLLNQQKMQLMCFGSQQQLDMVSIGDVPVLSMALHPQSIESNLGVILDSQLT